MNAPGPDQPRRGYCDHPRLHWHYPCDSCRAEERAELANLRIDKSALDMQVDSLTDQNDHLRDLLEYERERLATLRTALARAEATAEKAVEALEAQGAVVEALNAENARLCADLLAVEGQGMERRCACGLPTDKHGIHSEPCRDSELVRQLRARLVAVEAENAEAREDRFKAVALHTRLADALGVDPDPESLASLIDKAIARLRAERTDGPGGGKRMSFEESMDVIETRYGRAIEALGDDLEVRVEWAAIHAMFDESEISPDDIVGEASTADVMAWARQFGRTVYRRTVTTSPWVKVPAEPEGPDHAR